MNKEQAYAYRAEVNDLLKFSGASLGEKKAFVSSFGNDPQFQMARNIVLQDRREQRAFQPQLTSIDMQASIVSTRNRADRIPKQEVPFPEDPEERFERFLAAVANLEAKIVTYLSLSSSPITAYELYKAFLANTANIWDISKSNLLAYCTHTLIPIGLVAEADVLPFGASEYVTGFRTTAAGEKYKPIAAKLLQESVNLPVSLGTLFGATGSSGETRAVNNRARIMEYLAGQQEAVRRVDIFEALRIDPMVAGKALKHLNNIGMVEYSSVNSEERGQFKYRLVQGAKRENVINVKEMKTLTRIVADIVFELQVADTFTVEQMVKERFPEHDKKSLESNVGHILSGLIQQGVCKREKQDFVNRKIQSHARITPAGKRIVENIISPIRQALAGDDTLLVEWLRIPWQKYAASAVEKHRDQSGYTNKQQAETRKRELLALLREHPGMRPGEINKRSKTLPKYLQLLVEDGKIRKEKKGKAARYYIVE